MIYPGFSLIHVGSGNESEIMMLMLDKSTYFKKAALFSLQSVRI